MKVLMDSTYYYSGAQRANSTATKRDRLSLLTEAHFRSVRLAVDADMSFNMYLIYTRQNLVDC